MGFNEPRDRIKGLYDRRFFLKSAGLWLAASGVALPMRSALAADDTPAGDQDLSLEWDPRNFGFRSNLVVSTTALPILQGATDRVSAQFKILASKALPPTYRVLDSRGNTVAVDKIDRIDLFGDPSRFVDHVRARGLRLGESYRLQLLESGTGRMLDEREFSAFDVSKPNVRFAVMSCLGDKELNNGIYDALANNRPDLIFMIGDCAYVDGGSGGTVEGFWRRHAEIRSKFFNYYWRRLIPTYAVWDDHDFGTNDGNRNFPMAADTKRAFETFFHWTPSSIWRRGPGVSSVVETQHQRFVFMDGRSFRDEPNLSRGLHWGEKQEDWLIGVLQSSAKPTWILNGTMYFGAYLGVESFEANHAWQFRRVMSRLAKEVEAPVMFCSGDVHFSELMNLEPNILGYPSVEIVSSSLHSFTVPLHQYRRHNPRRVTSTWRHNFVSVDSLRTGSGIQGRATSIAKNGNPVFSEPFSVQR